METHTTPEPIFLLGGADLEMETIKSLLDEKGIKYISNCSNWSDALLSKYEKELKEYNNADLYNIYGIELKENISFTLPLNYTRVDHHNDFSHKPSSLEQVAEILGITLTREQKLIAVNDSRHINGLKEAGATDSEIEKIRADDRKAQGVTEQDEIKARNIVENIDKEQKFIVIESPIDYFSPIVDRLYPCNNILIYKDDKLTYYGAYRSHVEDFFNEKIEKTHIEKIKANCNNLEFLEKEIKDKISDSTYKGGGDKKGFYGIKSNVINANELEGYVKELQQDSYWTPSSYHIFYFPFIWKINKEEDRTLSEQVDFSNLPDPNSISDWETGFITNHDEDKVLYNEKNYYFPFVHKVLYDTGKEDTIIKHYERREPKSREVKYEIVVKINDHFKKIYTLDIEYINLNFYSTGVGILSIYVKNKTYTEPEDVLRINQYGRRVFPPFYDDITNRGETAVSLSIKGLNGDTSRYSEDFKKYDTKSSWKHAMFIKSLIEDYNADLLIAPVIDDRMFVNSWYGNSYLSKQLLHSQNDINPNEDETNSDAVLREFMDTDFWYKYLFIDCNSVTCQNDKMRREIIETSTYRRWQKQGSLYGCSHYSFVLLTDSGWFPTNVLGKHMQGIYSRMVELVLIQRASMLRFSDEVSKVSYLSSSPQVMSDHVSSLYKEYIRFINQSSFRKVTAQDQGRELYSMMLTQFDTEAQIKNLDEEIEELHNYISLLIERKRGVNGMVLNVIATIFLPASFIVSFFGMNEFTGFFDIGLAKQCCIMVVFTILIWMIYKRIEKR